MTLAGLGIVSYTLMTLSAVTLFKDVDLGENPFAVAGKWFALPGLFTVFCVFQVAMGRMPFFAPPPEKKMQMATAVLNNSMEQLVMHILCQLALAGTLPPAWAIMLPVTSVMWVVGRIAFRQGYMSPTSPIFRGWGFMCAMFATVCSLVYVTLNIFFGA